ncbi:hypothetical protein ACOMHN_065900 [Nucella lapillus]
MPYRYRIDYRWNTLTDLKGRAPNRLNVINTSIVKRGKGGRRERYRDGQVRGADGSNRSAGKTTGPAVSWSDRPHKGHGGGQQKALGVVGPDCSHHTDVEDDYVNVRQEVEACLERQLTGGRGEGRYRVGGQVEEDQRLLHTLAQRLPPIHEDRDGTDADSDVEETEDPDAVDADPPTVTPATDAPGGDPPPLPPQPPPPPHPRHHHPTAQHTPLPSIPSHTAAPHSSRGDGDLTAAFMDPGKEHEPWGPHGEGPLAGSGRQAPAQTSDRLPRERYLAQDSPGRRPKPGHYPAETFLGRAKDHREEQASKSGSSDQASPVGIPGGPIRDVKVVGDGAKDVILSVEKKPLSQRTDKDWKEPELERGFDVIRTVYQHYSDTKPDREPDLKAAGHELPPYLSPREARFTDSPRKVCRRFKSRGTAGLTPQNPIRPNHLPLNGQPPTPVFQLRGRGTLTDPRSLFWRPLVSRLGHDPFADLGDGLVEEGEGTEGGSTVTHMPSKVILKVVLPRAVKSREGRLCGRQWSGLGQPPFQAWLSTTNRSPPPPPPPSAPVGARNEGSDDDDDDNSDRSDDNEEEEEEEDYEEEANEVEKDKADEEADDDNPPGTTNQPRASGHPSESALHPPQQEAPRQQEPPSEQPPVRSASFTDRCTRDKHTLAEILKGFLPQEQKARAADAYRRAGRPSQRAEAFRDKDGGTRATPPSVPPLNLNARMRTADSSLASPSQAGGGSSRLDLTSCYRAAYCDLLGPTLCPDCETARHRRQFTTRQELLYPQITVFPRHMVAVRKLQAAKGDKRRPSRLPQLSAPAAPTRWPSASVSASQLNHVVTDLDMCRRLAHKRQAARLSIT